MNPMRFRARRHRTKARIEIIPMIDIIFFLLVFYMVTSQAITQERGLGIELPEIAASNEAAASEVTLGLDAQGRLSLNQTPISFGTEAEALVAALRRNPQGLVVVRADRQVAHGLVVRAMDIARRAGVRRFAIAGAVAEEAP
jgi:biopolymer transport protein ExbD